MRLFSKIMKSITSLLLLLHHFCINHYITIACYSAASSPLETPIMLKNASKKKSGLTIINKL